MNVGTYPPSWARHTVRWVTRLEIAIGGLATAVIFALVLVQAAQRYLPVDGWPWTGELARFCLVWLTFGVVGVLVTTDSHIAIELLDTVRNPMVVRVVRVLALLIVAAIGFGFAAEAWSLIDSQGVLESPSLRMPMSWLYVLPLLGFASTVVRALVAAVSIALTGVPTDHEGDEVSHA